MNSKAVRSWIIYDWANSVFATTMMAAVLPIFYYDVAAATLNGNTATSLWGYTQSLAMLIVALSAPILGAIADMSGSKMRFLRFFSYLGIFSTALFIFVGKGDYLLASGLMVIATVGFSGATSFYDSLLPDLVPIDNRDKVSSSGYAWGYIGGGVLLAINLLMIKMPDLFLFPDTLTATRAVFLTVAIWWYVFSLPIFRNVIIPSIPVKYSINQYTAYGFRKMITTIKGIMKFPELVKYIIAFWFFNDGINTIITMATVYGREIGIGQADLIKALLITQFVGFPCTIFFGRIAKNLGSKPSLYISLSIYVVIVMLGYFMENALHFYILAVMVGVVQGGSQAIARSVYSNLVPAKRTGEFFGFLSVSSKFSSIFGPFLFAVVGQLTGSSRLGILSLVLFFIIGIIMLTQVKMDKGIQEATMESA